MAEHPPDVEKPEERKCDRLELALGPVSQDRGEHERPAHENGHGHEETVPAGRARCRVTRELDGRDPHDSREAYERHRKIMMKTRSARILPECGDGDDREETDRHRSACKQARANGWNHYQPTPVRVPGVRDILREAEADDGDCCASNHKQARGEESKDAKDLACKSCRR